MVQVDFWARPMRSARVKCCWHKNIMKINLSISYLLQKENLRTALSVNIQEEQQLLQKNSPGIGFGRLQVPNATRAVRQSSGRLPMVLFGFDFLIIKPKDYLL